MGLGVARCGAISADQHHNKLRQRQIAGGSLGRLAMKTALLALAVILQLGNTTAAAAACSVTVSEQPVVMRIGKDEFRIAFGVNSDTCRDSGCTGTIRYQAAWQTEDGLTNVERKLLSFSIPNGASKSIAVDRHYFDTAEGKHTTDVVRVSVDDVSCSRS